MDNASYHADPAISASHLHAIAKSPANYYARFLDPNRPLVEPTAAMRLGTLVHCAVLEPDELDARFGIAPDRRTKAGKEQAADMSANGIEAVSGAEMELAISMRNAVRSHAAAAQLLSDGKAEQSFWWDDSSTGMRCKCRPDWFYGSTIIDLKTTTDASPVGFAKSVVNWRYHVQQAHYLSAGFADRFIFIAVEKNYPYNVGIYQLDADATVEGEALAKRDLRRIATCQANNQWPGYSESITSLSLPRWAYDNTITPEDF
jgi:hypothetical protein